MGAACQCGATDAACRLCVCVWREEYCPNKDAHMRDDSCQFGFCQTNSVISMRFTFCLDLFDTNRTCLLHSILRVIVELKESVFFLSKGWGVWMPFSLKQIVLADSHWNLSRVTELCNPSLLRLLLVSQRTLMWHRRPARHWSHPVSWPLKRCGLMCSNLFTRAVILKVGATKLNAITKYHYAAAEVSIFAGRDFHILAEIRKKNETKQNKTEAY